VDNVVATTTILVEVMVVVVTEGIEVVILSKNKGTINPAVGLLREKHQLHQPKALKVGNHRPPHEDLLVLWVVALVHLPDFDVAVLLELDRGMELMCGPLAMSD
jgi:hypothetical protein